VQLSGEVVIVTGAARGMGAEVARACRREGAEVLVVDRDPAVTQVGQEIGARTHIGEVTDPALAARVVDDAVARHGRLTGLANVAGIHRAGSAAEVTDEDWASVLAVNLTGPMVLTRAALPAMTAAGHGSVVSFASIAASRGRPDSVAYNTSKAGLLGFTRSVAMDFGPHGIRANTLSPGTIDTPMFREHEARGGEGRDVHLPHILLRRLGTTADIAAATVFLLSSASAYVTGHDLLVDGGRNAGT